MRLNVKLVMMVALICGTTALPTRGDIVIESTFDSGTEGWTKLPGSDPGSAVTWVSTGGNPDGFMEYVEVGAGFLDFTVAPARFLGDKSLFYGGTLSFDITTNTVSSSLNRDNDVRLLSTSAVLRFDFPDPVVGTWTSRSVSFLETDGWINESTGIAPTQAEMQAVLGNLTGFHLMVDFRSGPERPSYDNIRFFSTAVLLGDVNQDGTVNLLDVQPFVDLLTSGGFQSEADINQDGEVTLLDVAPFVDLLTGG